MKHIYIVTVIEDIDTGRQISNKRALGWYSSLKKAQTAIENEDKCGMRECLYDYVLIEQKVEGAYTTSTGEWWYKWDYDKRVYKPFEKPHWLRMFVNFGMG